MRWLDGITDSMDTSSSKLGASEGRGSLACCRPWGHKESDTTVTEQQKKKHDQVVCSTNAGLI